jgi:hypothetical protein
MKQLFMLFVTILCISFLTPNKVLGLDIVMGGGSSSSTTSGEGWIDQESNEINTSTVEQTVIVRDCSNGCGQKIVYQQETAIGFNKTTASGTVMQQESQASSNSYVGITGHPTAGSSYGTY